MLKPEMSGEAAVSLLRLFDSDGIDVWLDGGWAVDRALGEQTRSHKDLDIILFVKSKRSTRVQNNHSPSFLHVFQFEEHILTNGP